MRCIRGHGRQLDPAARFATALIFLVAAGAVSAGGAAAQETGSVEGRVLDTDGRPVAGAEVRVVTLDATVLTDGQGSFRLAALPPGGYLLRVESARSGYAVERVVVAAGGTAKVEVLLSRVAHGQDIVVSVGQVRREAETFQATDVVTGDELAREGEASLGETLDGRPGITSTSFGQGASRPVIRGLGGDRVRILEDGVGTGDASSTSPDHAVGLEPGGADRIEIVRGPATLLYGSSAIGGVVNVIDRRIPTEPPSGPVAGRATVRGGTVADERFGSAEVGGSLGRIAWRVSALGRDTDDYAVPAGGLPDGGGRGAGAAAGGEPPGPLPDSFVETVRAAAGLSWVGDGGHVGVAASGLDKTYGIPGPGHAGEDAAGEGGGHADEGASVDLRQRRIDAGGVWRPGDGVLRRVAARFGLTDYRHEELEGGEAGTTFENDALELRVEARHRLAAPLEGTAGLQVRARDFAALGEEAFVPPTQTDAVSLFLLEETGVGPVRVQAGARLELQGTTNAATGAERDDASVSASLGVTWRAAEDLVLALNGARSVKHPNAEELFSDGPHLATRAFEIGDPDLRGEVGHSLDASVRLTDGRVRGSVSVFATSYDGFIHQASAGTEREDLPVLRYVQEDALFRGYEAEVEVDLFHHAAHGHHLVAEAWSDAVRAELTGPDEPLPRIPPLRLGGGLRYEGGPWSGVLGVRRVTGQERVAPGEEPTAGHTLLDASVRLRVLGAGTGHEITLRGTNLTDELARDHVSFLKDVAPLPGREVRLTYSLSF